MAHASPASLTFSDDELVLIDRAARQSGQSRSGFIQDAAVTTARRVCDYWRLSADGEADPEDFMPVI